MRCRPRLLPLPTAFIVSLSLSCGGERASAGPATAGAEATGAEPAASPSAAVDATGSPEAEAVPSRAERREHVRLHGAERHTRDTGRKTLVSPELTATLLAGAAAVGPEPEADGRAREEVIVDALAVLWDQPEAMSRELRAIYVCGRSSPPFAFVEAEIAALLAELGGASAPGGPVDEGREPFRHALSVLDFELNDEETARLYPDEDFPPCPEPPR